MAFYKKRVVVRDTPADVEWRHRYRAAAEQTLAELQQRFPVLSADNFEAANKFREQRLTELLKR